MPFIINPFEVRGCQGQQMASCSLCRCFNSQLVNTSFLCHNSVAGARRLGFVSKPHLPSRLRSVKVERGRQPATATSMFKVEREKLGPGEESVWDYPRPPCLEPVKDIISVKFNDAWISHTQRAYRVLETSHPPGLGIFLLVYYIPKEDINMEYVTEATGSSFCEWKGQATYWTVSVNGKTLEKVGWSYEQPTDSFLPLKGYIAFYATQMDCFVGAERAEPQPGGFYGGWVTSKIKGPFKGGPGSWGW